MFIVELSLCGSVSVCRKNGSEISPKSKLGQDLADCVKTGDCQEACQYVINTHKPEFRIVAKVGDHYENILADDNVKRRMCEMVYFDSETDFSDMQNAELYLVWEAAAQYESSLVN